MSSLLIVAIGWTTGLGSSTVEDPVLAGGWEAVLTNPALLDMSPDTWATLDFLECEQRVRSNSFATDDYLAYFTGSPTLTDRDKAHLLNRLGANPLRLGLGTRLRAAQAQYRSWGLAIGYEGASSVQLPHDLVELALSGNEVGRCYDLSRLAFDTLRVLHVTGARSLKINERLRIGAGLTWLHGFRSVFSESSAGELLTTPLAITGFISQIRREAQGGEGFSLTCGGRMELKKNWWFGLCARDLPAGIWWHTGAGRRRLTIVLDSLSVNRYLLKGSLDSIVATSDTYESLPGFWSAIPGVLAAGIGYERNRTYRFAALVNLPIGDSPTRSRPAFVGLRAEIRTSDYLHFGFTLGWSSGWCLEALASGRYRDFVATLGIGLQSRVLTGAQSISASVRIGREFINL